LHESKTVVKLTGRGSDCVADCRIDRLVTAVLFVQSIEDRPKLVGLQAGSTSA
jgi:hypothetical protein